MFRFEVLALSATPRPHYVFVLDFGFIFVVASVCLWENCDLNSNQRQSIEYKVIHLQNQSVLLQKGFTSPKYSLYDSFGRLTIKLISEFETTNMNKCWLNLWTLVRFYLCCSF